MNDTWLAAYLSLRERRPTGALVRIVAGVRP